MKTKQFIKNAVAVKRPTRRDVAELAGVAPSTVSLILTQRSGLLGIAEATRLRVESAAKTLGYYPNKQIHAIRSGRTGAIGLYLRFDQWGTATGYWAALRAALERAVSEADLQLLVHCARDGCPTEEAFARQAGGVVDGVIILNSGNDPIAQRLMDTRMLAVEIGDWFSPLPYVAVDGAQGVWDMMRHLQERGYRRPGFVGFPSPYKESSSERRTAFVEAGVSLFGKDLPEFEVIVGGEAVDLIVGAADAPDAFVCTSDELAFGAVLRARELGMKLGVTGFDCIPTLGSTFTLTSVATPLDELAHTGVRKLLSMIDGKPYERNTVLPVGLRVGDTT